MGINCMFYAQNSELVCRLQTQWKVVIEYTNKNLKVSFISLYTKYLLLPETNRIFVLI